VPTSHSDTESEKNFVMFNVSFTEVLVVVTAAGILLGRKELTIGAKFAGNVVGKLVGSLQGLRVKYEQKSSNSELNTLHTSVRSGLRGIYMCFEVNAFVL
jgi:Sec-independent protein translocase protein TatA